MPLYVTRGNYTPQAIGGLIAKPEDRAEAVGALLSAAGARLVSFYFTFGDSDFLLIAEAPSEKEVLAALLAAAGSGAVSNLSTCQALSSADMKNVLGKAAAVAQQYRPAGR
jgi:uncharacterized protein with GYD domain